MLAAIASVCVAIGLRTSPSAAGAPSVSSVARVGFRDRSVLGAGASRTVDGSPARGGSAVGVASSPVGAAATLFSG
jgi:hypothetical protein